MSNDTLLLVDVSGWIAVALFGNPGGAANAEGVPVDGPNAFFRRLFALFEQESPGYLMIACDSPSDSLMRKQWFPAYKAKRPPKDEVFALQSKVIYKAMNALELPMCRIDQWEADDVIASYAHQYAGAMEKTIIASNDKDIDQLLDLENVRILKQDGSLFFRKHAETRWGVPVSKIRHVQALAGDSADGIPGAHKIGLKKAVPLILKYGSAKKAKAAAEEQTPGIKISLRNFDADLNLKLVTLHRSLPIPEDLHPWTPPPRSVIQKTLQRFGLTAPM
jgi:DNA polymerase-1